MDDCKYDNALGVHAVEHRVWKPGEDCAAQGEDFLAQGKDCSARGEDYSARGEDFSARGITASRG